jgi:hypothetical protein
LSLKEICKNEKIEIATINKINKALKWGFNLLEAFLFLDVYSKRKLFINFFNNFLS